MYPPIPGLVYHTNPRTPSLPTSPHPPVPTYTPTLTNITYVRTYVLSDARTHARTRVCARTELGANCKSAVKGIELKFNHPLDL